MTNILQAKFPQKFAKRLVVNLLAAVIFCSPAVANHIIGGEITYQYLADVSPDVKRYLFTLIVYRDCDSGGAQLDDPAFVSIFKNNPADTANFIEKLSLDLNLFDVDPVIPACADVHNLPSACVERGEYSFIYDFQLVPDSSYFIVYQRCCRTAGISNIPASDNYGSTYMIELTPMALALGNSSPVFKNYPPGFICNNFKLNFDHSAFDADSDSMAYSFCTPYHGGGRQNGNNAPNCEIPRPNPPCGPPFEFVPFGAAYSALNPMGGNPQIAISPDSGQLSGRPNKKGQFVVGICVQEFRNGQLLSTVLRDFQFNVVDCVPAVSANVLEDSLLGPKQFLLKSCGNKNVSIINQSPQSTSTLTNEWVFDLKNGNLFQANSWHTTVPFPDTGTYYGILYLNTGFECADTGYMTVKVFPPISASFSYSYDSCEIGPVLFLDKSATGAPGGLTNWQWVFNTDPPVNLKSKEFEHQFPNEAIYQTKLTVTDVNGCKASETKPVEWFPKPLPEIPELEPKLVCIPNGTLLDLFADSSFGGVQLTWDFGDGSPRNFQFFNPEHFYKSAGNYSPSVSFSNDYGCFATDTFVNRVVVRPAPKADFDWSPLEISNLRNEVQFRDLSDSAVVWQWRFGSEGGSNKPNPVHEFRDTGLAPINLIVLNEYGCPDSIQKILDVVPLVKLYIPNVFRPGSTEGLGNERFAVAGILPGYTDFNMRIWNRWGGLVFESRDPETGWDGRQAGSQKTMPSGAYVYEIWLTGPRGERLRWEGTVSLL